MIDKPLMKFQRSLENYYAFRRRKENLLEDLRKLIQATIEYPI